MVQTKPPCSPPHGGQVPARLWFVATGPCVLGGELRVETNPARQVLYTPVFWHRQYRTYPWGDRLVLYLSSTRERKGWTNLFEELRQLRVLVVGDDAPHACRQLCVLHEPHTRVNAGPGCSRGSTWSRLGLWVSSERRWRVGSAAIGGDRVAAAGDVTSVASHKRVFAARRFSGCG